MYTTDNLAVQLSIRSIIGFKGNQDSQRLAKVIM